MFSMNFYDQKNVQAIVESPTEDTLAYPRRGPPTNNGQSEPLVQEVFTQNLESAQITLLSADRAIFFLKSTDSLK